MKYDHSSPVFVTYINSLQYNTYLNSKDDFYLIFELSQENRKFLLTIAKDCLRNEHFCGMVFVVDKNEILFDRLFFLRQIILVLLQNKKKTGVWGVPRCVEQMIFGSYHFSQVSLDLVPDNSSTYSKFIPTYQQHSSLILSCYKCIAVDTCNGLGLRIENTSNIGYRTAHKYRKRSRDTLFKTDNEAIQKLYNTFSEHVDNSDLRFSDRYLYFVNNIDFGSPYSFTDRFVYHCDYLPPHEYEQELSFLKKHVENNDFLTMIFDLVKKGEVAKIAYSKAQKSNVSRESFYLAPVNERSHTLLSYFNIDLDTDFPNKVYGVGIDFYDGNIFSYKVYFMYPSEILLQLFPQYFKKIKIDLTKLSEKEHYHVLRLDTDKNIVTDRIDIVWNKKDHLLFKPYLDLLPFSDKIMEDMRFFTFAFEFEKMELSKMNIYYRNKF